MNFYVHLPATDVLQQNKQMSGTLSPWPFTLRAPVSLTHVLGTWHLSYLCVWFSLTWLHFHSDRPLQKLSFLSPHIQLSGSFSAVLTESAFSLPSLFPSPLWIFLPFPAAIIIHLFHLACRSCHYHFEHRRPSSPLQKQPERYGFRITMRKMLTFDRKHLLLHIEQNKQNKELGSFCLEWYTCAWVPFFVKGSAWC